MSPRVLAVVVIAVLAVGFFAVRGCGNEEEERVKRSLAAMVEAVETGDREALEMYIARDYSDRFGHDQETAVTRVMNEVEHYPSVKVTLAHLDISIEDKSGFATVRFVPEFEGEADEALKVHPKYRFEAGQRLRLTLRKDGERYEVLRADMGMSLGGALND
ncbi:MAG: hypothetical protein R3F39_17210 [Myxococcota bacterium]